MDVATLDKFVTALELSGLLTPEQFDDVRQLTTTQRDPQIVARELMRRSWLTRWQAGQLLLGRTAFFLGKYRLLDHLGTGGMGTVFLAQHATMNRRVALKVLGKKFGNNPGAMQRFLSEARAIASLDHPNIVQAYSVDNEDDQFYLVMEYVDGRDLQQIVEKDGLPDYSFAADAVRQAAEGLDHAHRRGMVHCDIKPANLLVNQQGVVKILDMGVARLTGGDGGTASSESPIMGTVDYMAPEQGLGAHTFDHRADIYSLGCTLYFLLVGQPPFPDGTLAQRIIKHQTQQPRNILEKRPDAPRDLVRICRKMMAKEPGERFQSAAEVSQALAQWNPESRVLKRAEAIEATPPQGEAAPAAVATAAPGPADSGSVGSGPRSSPRNVRGPGSSGVRRRPTPASGSRNVLIVAGISVALVVIALAATIPLLISRMKPPKPAAAPRPAPAAKHADDEMEPWRRYWRGLDKKDDEPAPGTGPAKPSGGAAKPPPAAGKPSSSATGAPPAGSPAAQPARAAPAAPGGGTASAPAKGAKPDSKPTTPTKPDAAPR